MDTDEYLATQKWNSDKRGSQRVSLAVCVRTIAACAFVARWRDDTEPWIIWVQIAHKTCIKSYIRWHCSKTEEQFIYRKIHPSVKMYFDIRLTTAVLFCVSIRCIIPFLIEGNCAYAQYNDTGIAATDFTEIYGDRNNLLNSPQVLNVPNERWEPVQFDFGFVVFP